MKKHFWKKALAGLLAGAFLFSFSGSPAAAPVRAYAAESASVTASSLNLRSGPGTDYEKVKSLPHGMTVTILETTSGSDGQTWAKVDAAGTTGYVLRSYLATGNAVSGTSAASDASFEAQLSEQGFPESYKARLRVVHEQYPQWTFRAVQTGIDWNDAVQNESVVGRNLVQSESISSWKSTAEGAYNWQTDSWPGFDSSSWVAASQDLISYYMDPRNFLDTSYIFQFMTQTYDASTQTASGVEALVRGTFMESTASGDSGSSMTSGNSDSSSGLAPDGSQAEGSVSLVGPSGSTGTGSASETETQSSSGTSDESSSYVSSGTAPTEGTDSSGEAIGVISGPPQEKAESAGEGSADEAQSSFENVSVPENSGGTGSVLRVSSEGVVGHGASSVPSSSGSSSSSAADSSSSGSTGGSSASSAAAGINYTDVIMEAAQQSGVNPYVLTSMILEEQGKDGKSDLISGNNSTYPGIYNYYNIEAYQDGSMSAVTRGLWWASRSGSYMRPWDTREKAIIGGAIFYGENFVSAGQNTFYLKKFNVTSNNTYQHQYMTNVQGAAEEGRKMGEAYSEELKAQALSFEIPVYENMPADACPLPSTDGSPNNKLKSLSTDGFSLTPSFDMNTESYDLIVDPSVTSITVRAESIVSSATVAGTGDVTLNADSQDITITVTAENGSQRNYVIHVTRQAGGQMQSYSTDSGSGQSGTNPDSDSAETVSAGTSAAGVTVSGTSDSGGSVSTTPPTSSGSASVQLVSPSG